MNVVKLLEVNWTNAFWLCPCATKTKLNYLFGKSQVFRPFEITCLCECFTNRKQKMRTSSSPLVGSLSTEVTPMPESSSLQEMKMLTSEWVSEETLRVYDQMQAHVWWRRPRVLSGARLPDALSLLGSIWDVHWFASAHKKEPLLRKAMEEETPRSLNAGSGALFPG